MIWLRLSSKLKTGFGQEPVSFDFLSCPTLNHRSPPPLFCPASFWGTAQPSVRGRMVPYTELTITLSSGFKFCPFLKASLKIFINGLISGSFQRNPQADTLLGDCVGSGDYEKEFGVRQSKLGAQLHHQLTWWLWVSYWTFLSISYLCVKEECSSVLEFLWENIWT